MTKESLEQLWYRAQTEACRPDGSWHRTEYEPEDAADDGKPAPAAIPEPAAPKCDHGVTFDEEAAQALLESKEIRKRWPRLHGTCPKGCGYSGIYYASWAHYIMGDW